MSREERLAAHRKRMALYRAAHPEQQKKYANQRAERIKTDPIYAQHMREYMKEYNKKNRARLLEKERERRNRYGREHINAQARARTARLTDGQVAEMMNLPISALPKEVLEAKRIQIRLRRVLRSR